MKVEQLNKIDFKPIELKITIESVEDLQWLMAISNASISDAKSISGEPMSQEQGAYDRSQMALYNAVEDIYKEHFND